MSPEQELRFKALSLKLRKDIAEQTQRDEEKKKLALALKDGKRRAKLALDQTGESTNEIAKRLRDLSDAENWAPVSQLVTGQEQRCRCCGHHVTCTTGFFVKEQHRNIPSARRLRVVNALREDLETASAIEYTELDKCIKCVEPCIIDDLLDAVAHSCRTPQITPQLRLDLQ